MEKIIKSDYDSLLEIDLYSEDEVDGDLIITDNIFMYDQICYLKNCLVVLLLIWHFLHAIIFGGDISPSITRFKIGDNGIFALVLNILVPCIFFVQGWLKAFEIHKQTSFIKRLHIEFLIPIFIYVLFYLVSILFKNDTHLENLTNEEFGNLLSKSGYFNPGFLSTFLLLFLINLVLDSTALVIVPHFYVNNSLIFYKVNNSLISRNYKSGNVSNEMDRKYFSVLKNFSFYKLIYCLLMVLLYDSLLDFLNNMEPKNLIHKSKISNIFSVLILLIMCKIFKNSPRIFYYVCFIGSFINLIICSSFGSYINCHFSASLISSFHFLLNVFFTGTLISCMNLEIFKKWQFSIFFTLCSVLCHFTSADYSRSIISPLIFPSIFSIKSRFLTVSQIFSSIFAILSISIQLFKCFSSKSKTKSLRAINSTILLCFSLMLCISSIKLFFE
ncbi:hypothetical protein [Cryptosporidium parvum Iowa II]|uniref:Uncharacterized protein n=2 Tax=Cryptosporidium parvum TaxID=5807 RepID=Q5CPH5_CRYPI|nr:hypothetical protein [Cryptosporidium parvum Iowa II]EAK87327.1 hypothetical protein with 11 transmembrane domains [Cryptosporidium parvum Iowa II]QOY42349.1 Uncharacterized protein CPATCC_0030880 [Cryptosporidium parvum]WKS76742.1 transmembrane domain-containing protein [Cryptosporidium sp. 43IA8]WRK31235.1 Uncharacterized protein cpbgf_30030 [Cryptosporidium parvum]|eukprot:QOY42349.1 hypothetical protein CPATCC_000969 [Cryptosporidium parvum]